ncbi:hypothetical protein J2S58_002078 [Nakamurella flavida]|uniref:septum formation family protein n=1 Tax=Nakamurella flavida TaxID=363630 RepID=UPI002786D345|nr:septum formation family protein [Nakamurella flavida]MDP9778455.1 hypothetical protein [Nakamurella flavida]
MDRRVVGAAVLVAVLAAVAVVSALRPTVPGSPVAAPPAPPPSVGQCLPRPLTAQALAEGGLSLTSVPVGDCTDRWFGEVVARYGSAPTSAGMADLYTRCTADTTDYLGLPRAVVDRATGDWAVPVIVPVALLEPTRQQLGAGQSWVACVVRAPAREPIVGWTTSVRGTWPDHPLFRDLTQCADAVEAQGRGAVDCREPHRVETLGFAPAGDADQAELDASCRAFAARVTLLPDVSAGGRLVATASVQRIRTYSSSTGDPDPAATYTARIAGCVLRTTDPDTRLTSSLVGWGDADLPLG